MSLMQQQKMYGAKSFLSASVWEPTRKRYLNILLERYFHGPPSIAISESRFLN